MSRYAKSDNEFVCLQCPLFECKEGSRGCLYTELSTFKSRAQKNKEYYERNKAKLIVKRMERYERNLLDIG